MATIKRVILTLFLFLQTLNAQEIFQHLFEELQMNRNQEVFHAEELSLDEVSLAADCEPLLTVADCVNVSSGHFFQSDLDLQGQTVDPLCLKRFYDSDNAYETWMGVGFGSQFPILASDRRKSHKYSYAMISERENSFIPYRGDIEANSHRVRYYTIDPKMMKKGYTNTNRQGSGKDNFINWRGKLNRHSENKQFWTITQGEGIRRVYGPLVCLPQKDSYAIKFPSNEAHLLTEQTKANGNRLLFSYQPIFATPCLAKIQTVNRTGDAELNAITIKPTKEGFIVESSCKQTIEYKRQWRSCSYKDEDGDSIIVPKALLNTVISSQKGSTTYVTEQGIQEVPKVIKIEKPQGRFLKINYNSKNQVSALKAPLRKDGKSITIYRFEYDKYYTKVWNALDQQTNYYFDKNQRLQAIEELDENYRSISQKHFEWSQHPGQEGWLRAKTFGKNKELLYRKTYRYDAKGNCIQETLYGNLTGEKPQTFTLDQIASTDRRVTIYEYFNNRNLLKKETTSEGLSILYEYEPETNLCTQELHFYDNRVQERFFKSYDTNGELIELVEDDGSGLTKEDLSHVTYRRIKSIRTSQEVGSASFGKPILVVEAYRHPQTGETISLNCTKIAYDTYGNEIQRCLYNSQGKLQKEWTKAYDERQRLIQESDAIGHVTCYAYDENNNKIAEVQGEHAIVYTYDVGNRLIAKNEKHTHGPSLETRYEYNALNQLIAEVDLYGNRTTYEYDRSGNKVRCIQPAMQDETGAVINPTWTKRYNHFNQMIATTDEKGSTTHYTYNSQGKPTKIVYPDHSEENRGYYPCGWLQYKIFADGTSLHYQYDAKGRIVKELTIANNEILKEQTYQYKGSLLQTKTDANKTTTHYFYDGAGRKIREIIGNHEQVTFYSYDDLGRVIGTYYAIHAQEGQWIRYQYDGLDHVTAKEYEDFAGKNYGKETFVYDRYGYVIRQSIWQSPEKIATTEMVYNSNGDLLSKTDPLGYQTLWTYDYQETKNELGQIVKKRLIHDPLGRLQEERYDAFGRLEIKKSYTDNQESAYTRYIYQANGQLIKEISSVRVDGVSIRDYGVLKTYDACNRVITETEYPQGKTIQFVYDIKGQLIQKIKPDNVSLFYRYDHLGRLSQLTSSDGTLHYEYTYDANNNPISVEDRVHKISQKCAYDSLNRMVKEEIQKGIEIHYQYDSIGRVTQLTLPNGTWIRYLYNAYHLTHVQRFNAMGQLQYACECPDYTLDRKILKIVSPAGLIQYTYDLLGRVTSIQAKQWQVQLDAFDAVGNLIARTPNDPSGNDQEVFTYNRFDHLTSESANSNTYQYDSLGNCLVKNQKTRVINAANQVLDDGDCQYTYDVNGNLLTQSQPQRNYRYDAYNRLIQCQTDVDTFSFIYDAWGRCLKITNSQGTRDLLYQGNREMGSLLNRQLDELKVIHPAKLKETVFAIELQNDFFFPIQDERYNICALQRSNGSLANWKRYSVFGITEEGGENIRNPWGFANRREVANLILFLHRFYNPQLMRWQTTDPLGYVDGLNLYAYVHNNPFLYIDPDGQFAWTWALSWLPTITVEGTFGAAGVAFCSTYGLPVLVGALVVGVAAQYTYNNYYKNDESYDINNETVEITEEEKKPIEIEPAKKGRKAGRDNECKGGPPRDPKTMDYLPDPLAEGSPHTTFGIRKGGAGDYTQGATFNEHGKFEGRTDVTNHGRRDHLDVHYHPATGPDSARSKAEPINY